MCMKSVEILSCAEHRNDICGKELVQTIQVREGAKGAVRL